MFAAQRLVADGHEVVLHARDAKRAAEALDSTPGAIDALSGDLGSLAETKSLAERVNELGRFDAVIHNAGIGYREPRLILTSDGLAPVFQVNVLAPYVLTGLITLPKHLVYLSSGLHLSGSPDVDDLQWQRRHWSGYQAYCDSKLFDTMLAFAAARRWTKSGTTATSVEPGWVATKMGGFGAPDDLDQGSETQAWIAAGLAKPEQVNGLHLFHREPTHTNPYAEDTARQDRLLDACQSLSGVSWPPSDHE
jgi:NAD(P)-dependent dehydrogenase (short-subunit alcohol dehydrogenase family)